MKRLSLFVSIVFIVLLLGTPAIRAADERLERLSPDHRAWIEEEVVYIITDREREFFLSLATLEERDYFIEAFWRKRDPNPATSINEFKEEHYRRFEFANRYLGNESVKPGWKTDRGRMFIILGEPRERQRFDGLNEVVSTELWFYQGVADAGLPSFFYLVFFRPRDIGEYRLYHPALDGPRALLRGRYASLESNDSLEIQSRLYDVAPELSRASLSLDPSDPGDPRSGRVSLGTDILLTRIEEAPKRLLRTDYLNAASRYGRRVSAEYSFNFVPNRSVFYVLLADDTSALVHYSVELDPQDFALEADEEQSRFYTTLEVSLEVRDSEENLIYSDDQELYVELSRDQMNQVKALPFAFQNSFPLVPGEFNVSVLLKNRVMKRFTVAERPIEVPSLNGSPALGDAIVAFDVETAGVGQRGTFVAGPYRFRPAADHLFSLGDRLRAGVQFRNAGADSTLRMALAHDGAVLQEEVVPVGDRENGVVYEDFDLSSLDPGTYTVDIRLEDARDSVVAHETAAIQVTPRTAVPRANYVHRSGFDIEMPGLLALTRGNQFWSMKRFEHARQELERAVDADNPDLPMARWKLASVYLRLGQPDRSLELLQPIESEYANQYEVVAGLGFAHYFKQDFAVAAQYLERAAGLRPVSPSLLNALGECYEQAGDLENARVVFERSLALQPGQEVIEERLASMKTKQP